MGFSNYHTFLIECNKGPFLDVNLKTKFFGGQKPQAKKSFKKMSSKKFLSDLDGKLWILFAYKKLL